MIREADVIARIDYLFGDLKSQLSALAIRVSQMAKREFFEDPSPIGEGGSNEKWSYKVTASGGLGIKIAPGNRIVIHKSVTPDSTEITGSVSANSTSQVWCVYTYATDSTAASWNGPSVMSDPGQSSAHRAFLIATITSNDDSITSIVHNHVGDLEVYDLVQC